MTKSKRKTRRSVASNREPSIEISSATVNVREGTDAVQMNSSTAKLNESPLNGHLSTSSHSLSDTEISEVSNKPEPPLCNTVITVGSVSPKTFDGSTNVDEYVEHFYQIARCNNWSPKLQMSRIPIYLTGPANLWYRSFLNEMETSGKDVMIDNVFEAMRKEFRPQNHRTVYQSHLSSRKQGLNEPVQVYYYDVLNLCRRVNGDMSDEDKLFHLCQGLKSTLLEKVMPFEPRSCKELLQKCKSIEEAEVMANNRPHYNYLLLQEKKPQLSQSAPNDAPTASSKPVPSSEPTASTDSELSKTLKALAESVKESNELTKQLVENLSARPPNYRNNYRNPRVTNLNGQVVCYRCNAPGHTSRNCYLNTVQGQPTQPNGYAVSAANGPMQGNQNYMQPIMTPPQNQSYDTTTQQISVSSAATSSLNNGNNSAPPTQSHLGNA